MSGSFEIVSPVDGRVYARRNYATGSAVEAVVAAAVNAKAGWRAMPVSERGKAMRRFIDYLDKNRILLAEQISWQMGRPLAQADEVDAWTYSGDHLIRTAETAMVDQGIDADDGAIRHVRREPYGVMLSICPWNYPVSICVALVVPPLMAGNTLVFKHSPQTALVGDVLNDAAKAAGLPAGVFQAIDLTNEQAAKLIGSDDINIVGFIGSERGGRQVYQAAGDRFKPFLLELGGKDPVYLRSDIDVERAAQEIAIGAFGNSGQSCCSVERIYVDRSIHERFVAAFSEAASKTCLGHPIEGRPDIGPLVSAKAADTIRAQIRRAISAGAKAAYDGNANLGRQPTGAYLAPVVLTHVDHGMDIMIDETFGPVAPIMAVDSDEEAIRLMNDSRYGLTAAIWTKDIDRALDLGSRIEAGAVVVNQCNYPDSYLPWGGIKASGLGRSDGNFAYEGVTQYKSFYARPFP